MTARVYVNLLEGNLPEAIDHIKAINTT
jgi:hypothetical protein